MITKYEVVCDPELHALEIKVNEMMTYGWKLVGGISTVREGKDSFTMFYQAMTKEYIEEEQ